jgi:hypothetical protein
VKAVMVGGMVFPQYRPSRGEFSLPPFLGKISCWSHPGLQLVISIERLISRVFISTCIPGITILYV